jgi:hypothetical protein
MERREPEFDVSIQHFDARVNAARRIRGASARCR